MHEHLFFCTFHMGWYFCKHNLAYPRLRGNLSYKNRRGFGWPIEVFFTRILFAWKL